MNKTPKELYEVILHNKCYYKKVFDYYVFVKNKIRAFRVYKDPNYKKSKMNELFEQFMEVNLRI